MMSYIRKKPPDYCIYGDLLSKTGKILRKNEKNFEKTLDLKVAS